MWKQSNFPLPSVLIVESGKGDVFIVENKSTESQVEKILKKENSKKSLRCKLEVKLESREPSPVTVNYDLNELEDDVTGNDVVADGVNSFTVINVPFIDISSENLDTKYEPLVMVENLDKKLVVKEVPQSTFDGRWSDEGEDLDDSDFEEDEIAKKKKLAKKKAKGENAGARQNFWTHKKQSLVGKIACKYCETLFRHRAEKNVHICKYLQCNPKNFICRICGKELSRNTFSNHLHETLDCEYCQKQFVNPRNMKQHIRQQHSDQKFFHSQIKTIAERQKERENEVVITESGNVAATTTEKHRYQRKNPRLECDLCGKYLVSIRSMRFHMGLHTGTTRYICENCGEKFYTPNGIKGHKCEKLRRRPEQDYRINDLRHCRFCNSRFENLDQNKAHVCSALIVEDPKYVKCRCCSKKVLKAAFNRHMETHTGIEWNCHLCNKYLATQRALKVHMTIHSGQRPYKCKICSDSFINKKVLSRHMRFHGASLETFSCEFCFKQLASASSLKEHVRRLHTTTIKCELCTLEFETRDDVKAHILKDHGVNVCSICNKSFALPRYLKMHEKLHIYNEDRQPCPICARLLYSKNVRVHMFRHHKEQFSEWSSQNSTL